MAIKPGVDHECRQWLCLHRVRSIPPEQFHVSVQGEMVPALVFSPEHCHP
jgi:hypothetical protein